MFDIAQCNQQSKIHYVSSIQLIFCLLPPKLQDIINL